MLLSRLSQDLGRLGNPTIELVIWLEKKHRIWRRLFYFGLATIFRVKPCTHLRCFFAQPIYENKNDVVMLECDISLKPLMNLQKDIISKILTVIFRLDEYA